MKVLLDTDVCIAFLNGTDRSVRERLRRLQATDVRLCSVVKAELLYGARKSAKVSHNLQRLQSFFGAFASLAFDDAAAETYGLLRVGLERQGSPIGANDQMIAAIALTSDLTLVTRNVGEFARVPGLRVETW